MKNLFKFVFAAVTVAMLSTACGGAKTEEAAAEATPTEEAAPVEEAAPAEAAAPADSAAAPAEAAPAEAAH